MSLTTFTPIYAGRSDGETEIRTKKYGKEYNGPSLDQLNKVANPDDYYETLDVDHPLAIEWKRVLGGMLQKELRAQAEHSWFLMFFPENYRLYKHNKETRDHTGEFSNPVNPQGKPSNKLQDAYLYGYPQGRKKRYRSAQEFFPHFQWLMEGKSEDYGDCLCKHCAGDWVHKIEPLPGRNGFVPAKKESSPAKKEAATVKKENGPVKKEAPQVKRETPLPEPKIVVKQRPVTQENKLPKPPTRTPNPSAPISRPASASVPPAMMPAPLPLYRSKEQELDAQYGKFLYRPGELTWFFRGSAWGLAVVLKRDMYKDQQNREKPRYLVQPLSHPYDHPPYKIITDQETHLRPWLAWSAPAPTHQPLQPPSNLTYTTINWQNVIDGLHGPGDAEVDGSIFAAKQIDDSYTLFSPLSNNTTTTGERSYSILFLGGEKVYLGEAVRLRINNGQDIMILHQIIEKLKPNSTDISHASVHLVGDIYRLTTQPLTPQSQQTTQHLLQQQTSHLPARLLQDLTIRNQITTHSPTAPKISHYKLLSTTTRLPLSDIKGRWYESSILLPILHTKDAFAADISRGEVAEVGTWINGRGDANLAAGKVGTRFSSRVEAFGAAVPPGTKISRGLDEEEGATAGAGARGAAPAPAPAPTSTSTPMALGAAGFGGATQTVGGAGGQQQQQQQQRGQGQGQSQGEGDIAEFMDLDRMDSEGFGQGFGGGV